VFFVLSLLPLALRRQHHRAGGRQSVGGGQGCASERGKVATHPGVGEVLGRWGKGQRWGWGCRVRGTKPHTPPSPRCGGCGVCGVRSGGLAPALRTNATLREVYLFGMPPPLPFPFRGVFLSTAMGRCVEKETPPQTLRRPKGSAGGCPLNRSARLGCSRWASAVVPQSRHASPPTPLPGCGAPARLVRAVRRVAWSGGFPLMVNCVLSACGVLGDQAQG
jgi:hypothetical protein